MTGPQEAAPCCEQCGKPFPLRRRAPKTGLCRHCWSVKALLLRGVHRRAA
ncbi:hypothetical protein [Sphingobium yanoikuyae]|jgi:hypothetical protein|nr:hypothetical protein [Sphingobium yanoikuyae]